MFRGIIPPSSGALDCVYSLWYNAPTVLPVGALAKAPAGSTVGALHHKLVVYIIVSVMHGHVHIELNF